MRKEAMLCYAEGYRHNDEVKKFALTLHLYSLRAYEYVRSIFCLPHARSLLNWSSSVKCEPVFFEDVFLHLRNLVLDDAKNAECSLIFDAMTIKKGVILNKSKGCYEGFVDLGENIVACGEDDTVATEALIFMISALQSYWKYPIGYVLIDKINADNLYCLISRALQLSLDNNLKVRTVTCDSTAVTCDGTAVTCDGTATNFKSMKLLGCKIGENLNEIVGTFTFPGYSYDIFFTPDACHNKENILGYIVKKLQKIIDCNVCNNAMLSSNKYYFNLSLVTQKDRGGLVYPSTDIVKILSIAERVFK